MMVFETATIIAVAIATGLFLFWPKVIHNKVWRANITPLASIIGSGFLVLGPILDARFGSYAPAAMGALCIIAWFFGSAVRYNIRYLGDHHIKEGMVAHGFERAASWSLGLAYIVSVAYYLNLFGAFGVSLTEVDDRLHGKLLTTAIFIVILLTGWLRGFKALERMELYSVNAKLAIISGLLIGLVFFFARRASGDDLSVNPSEVHGWGAATLIFGLIVTTQGFETSRYLGKEYDAKTRIRSMRLAQWTSSAIYMGYIALMAFTFKRGELELSETAIIDMMKIVAPILPALLVAAALSAQFSAAVADTSGSGGLINELTHDRVKPQHAYVLVVALGIALTWLSNIFEIISYASRAFAIYYALQSGLAASRAANSGHKLRSALFAALCAFGVIIAIFGKAVDV